MRITSQNAFIKAKHPLIIAHRGFAEECHENTLEAFDKAIRLGADVIEFDVRKTKDGRLVAFHDESIGDKLLSSLEYKEIEKISVTEGFKIPTLEETLIFIRHRALLSIEIKELGYEKEASNTILKYVETKSFLIISFHDEVLKKIKKINTNIVTGLLLGKENPKKLLTTRLSEIFPHHRLKKCDADFIVPHFKIARLWRIARFIKPKWKMIVWTVNKREEILKLIKNGVTGIITDYPDMALKIRDTIKKKVS